MAELLESLKNVDKITAKQFKKIEKAITKKTWQGSLLITVIALKVPLYGVADDYFNMKLQAFKITNWGKNVYVKVPVINSKNKFSGEVIKKLNNKGIKK